MGVSPLWPSSFISELISVGRWGQPHLHLLADACSFPPHNLVSRPWPLCAQDLLFLLFLLQLRVIVGAYGMVVCPSSQSSLLSALHPTPLGCPDRSLFFKGGCSHTSFSRKFFISCVPHSHPQSPSAPISPSKQLSSQLCLCEGPFPSTPFLNGL